MFFTRLVLLFTWLLIVAACSQPVQAVTVVLDPGHGGKSVSPVGLYGDKYDLITGGYLDRFRGGAYDYGIYENEVMYQIAVKVQALLANTLHPHRHNEFKKMLSRYAKPPKTIFPIETHLSRRESYFDRYDDAKLDLNAEYRLYDYRDILTDETKLGTISRINALKPDLVVTMHLTGSNPGRNGALAAVITPSYDTYKIAIDYVNADSRARIKIRNRFLKGPYALWFNASYGYNHWDSFMSDAWIYFTGYWPTKNGLELNPNKYRGYRQNMFTWAYRDNDSWPDLVGAPGPYTLDLRTFKPEGPFWQRETDQPERWRREGGIEGYGGDNLFAAHEIFRFIRKGFLSHKVDTLKTAAPIKQPYLSTWAVPTYINAVSAYLEIAHLGSKRDRARMTYHRDIYAEAIAAGIYSLVYSLEVSSSKNTMPRGRALNFEKYRHYKNKNYFTQVTD